MCMHGLHAHPGGMSGNREADGNNSGNSKHDSAHDVSPMKGCHRPSATWVPAGLVAVLNQRPLKLKCRVNMELIRGRYVTRTDRPNARRRPGNPKEVPKKF